MGDETGALARATASGQSLRLGIFAGGGIAGDTTGNRPGSKWVAWNAIAGQFAYGRRYTASTPTLGTAADIESVTIPLGIEPKTGMLSKLLGD